MKRFRGMMAALALVALALLVLRPIALETVGVPYGTHTSTSLEVVQADGSQHCELLSDCESVSFTTFGISSTQTTIAVLVTGLITAFAGVAALRMRSWPALVPNPPPLTPLA